MLSGTCPNSPATLCAPRSSLPSTAMPDADAVGDVHERDRAVHRGVAPHRPHLPEHAGLRRVLDHDRQVRGRLAAAREGPRRASPGSGRTRAARWRPPAPRPRPRRRRTRRPPGGPRAGGRWRAATSLTSGCGRRRVGNSATSRRGWPSRSVSRRDVWLALTSTASTHRRRVSMCRCMGLRPRRLSPLAPSKTSPASRSSSTRRLIAPRRTPMRRASSARETGCFDRIRLSAICRLISREVPRRAIRNAVGLIRRMASAHYRRMSVRRADHGPGWGEEASSPPDAVWLESPEPAHSGEPWLLVDVS